MIYHLFEYLQEIGCDFPGIGLVKYITFRAMMAIMTALAVALYFGPKIIRKLQKLQIGEEIRDLGLEGQMAKKGTPTMGGIIILLSILIPALLFADLTNVYVILLIVTTLWLGFIGFKDDSIKVFKKNKEGLKGKYKIIGQVTLGLIVGLVLCLNSHVTIREKRSCNRALRRGYGWHRREHLNPLYGGKEHHYHNPLCQEQSVRLLLVLPIYRQGR